MAITIVFSPLATLELLTAAVLEELIGSAKELLAWLLVVGELLMAAMLLTATASLEEETAESCATQPVKPSAINEIKKHLKFIGIPALIITGDAQR